MVSKQHRFRGRGTIRYILKNGQQARLNNLTVRYLFNRHHKHYRVGVIVSRKVTKSAPKRNRIRRRIYEIIRKHETKIKADADFLVAVYDERVATVEHAKLEQSLLKLLSKANIL